MAKEIEKKFYVNIDGIHLDGYYQKKIIQNYLMYENIYQVRIREEINQNKMEHFLTYKEGNGLSRIEEEIKISPYVYHELDRQIKQAPIRKTRYLLPYKSKIIELDIFDSSQLLPVAEIEFNTLEELENFNYPEWFTRQCNKTNGTFWRQINGLAE